MLRRHAQPDFTWKNMFMKTFYVSVKNMNKVFKLAGPFAKCFILFLNFYLVQGLEVFGLLAWEQGLQVFVDQVIF